MDFAARRLVARSCLPLLLVGAVLLSLPPRGHAAIRGSDREGSLTGQQLYRKACANCHGVDGRGSPPSLLGFDLPVPDFTDCSFATREPDADWIAVAHEGGPARGFSDLMPAFGGVLDTEQLALVISHVREFCPNKNWPRGDLNLPRPLVTEKAYPEDEAVLSTAVATEGLGSIENKIVYEKRFGSRNQFELVAPFGWLELETVDTVGGDTDWHASLGDLALGVKHAFYHNLKRGRILSVTGEIILPTGDEQTGFGKGTVIFEPFVSYGQLLPAELFLHGQAGLELPANQDKAENELFARVALGRSFTSGQFGRTWSPMLEVLAARALTSDGQTDWDLVPQFQVTLNTRQHIMLNFGVRTPVTDTAERDTKVIVYLLWDWFDGGLTEGW